MKNQALVSSKDKSKKIKCRLLQFLFGSLRVNSCHCSQLTFQPPYNDAYYTLFLTIIAFKSL